MAVGKPCLSMYIAIRCVALSQTRGCHARFLRIIRARYGARDGPPKNIARALRTGGGGGHRHRRRRRRCSRQWGPCLPSKNRFPVGHKGARATGRTAVGEETRTETRNSGKFVRWRRRGRRRKGRKREGESARESTIDQRERSSERDRKERKKRKREIGF